MAAFVPSLNCPDPKLRGAQGIQRVAVDDGHARLIVTFFNPIDLPQQSYLLQASSYVLTGGSRLFPRVRQAELVTGSPPAASNQVALTLDTEGDFSIYTLTVTGPDIDPFFSSRQLRFRLACEDRFDCRAVPAAAPPEPEIPVVIDYLAKDYAGFRQALLDFLPTRLPAWTERSEADLGMMLLELLAATADNLSYMQDRVGNEAFVGTATQRRSVAGHLALLGYQMDQGASAHTWLQFQVGSDMTIPSEMTVQVSNRPQRDSDPLLIFETLGGGRLFAAHAEIRLATFGNADCCLPADALDAVVAGNFPDLRAGDDLLFDNGSGRRDIVRLTSVALLPAASPPGSPPQGPLTRIAWSASTPLSGDYCASATRISGNLALATHGETVQELPRSIAEVQQQPRLRVRLQNSPLAYLDTEIAALAPGWTAPAAGFTARASRSVSTLRVKIGADVWDERPTLLESRGDDHVFRVEIDDDGAATLVFGDNTFGARPPASALIAPTYRIGGGKAGNLGADTLTELRTSLPGVLAVTNPLPATGGRDRESRDQARRTAPATFQKPLVAVTAADYQAAATEFTDLSGAHPIQRANASFRWTGSWLTVLLTLDLKGGGAVDPALRAAFLEYLDGRRLAGYDLELAPAVYLPVDLAIEFCPLSGFLAADITQRLLETFSSGALPGGRKGFFHPDNFTFGDPLFVSRIYAAASAVAGVESAQITRLARLHAANPEDETAVNLKQGYLAAGPDQIIRLDNDRNQPENGALSIQPKEKSL